MNTKAQLPMPSFVGSASGQSSPPLCFQPPTKVDKNIDQPMLCCCRKAPRSQCMAAIGELWAYTYCNLKVSPLYRFARQDWYRRSASHRIKLFYHSHCQWIPINFAISSPFEWSFINLKCFILKKYLNLSINKNWSRMEILFRVHKLVFDRLHARCKIGIIPLFESKLNSCYIMAILWRMYTSNIDFICEDSHRNFRDVEAIWKTLNCGCKINGPSLHLFLPSFSSPQVFSYCYSAIPWLAQYCSWAWKVK